MKRSPLSLSLSVCVAGVRCSLPSVCVCVPGETDRCPPARGGSGGVPGAVGGVWAGGGHLGTGDASRAGPAGSRRLPPPGTPRRARTHACTCTAHCL